MMRIDSLDYLGKVQEIIFNSKNKEEKLPLPEFQHLSKSSVLKFSDLSPSFGILGFLIPGPSLVLKVFFPGHANFRLQKFRELNQHFHRYW